MTVRVLDDAKQNVLGVIAIFIALSASAYAVLPRDSVDSRAVENRSLQGIDVWQPPEPRDRFVRVERRHPVDHRERHGELLRRACAGGPRARLGSPPDRGRHGRHAAHARHGRRRDRALRRRADRERRDRKRVRRILNVFWNSGQNGYGAAGVTAAQTISSTAWNDAGTYSLAGATGAFNGRTAHGQCYVFTSEGVCQFSDSAVMN